jgi:DNA topoisomerase-1
MARRGGWKRVGQKRFRYVDSRGRAITHEEQLDRIRKLVIPPAWTDVWISPIAVGLVNHGWFRVGSERHARATRTYGITTLTKRHVSISGKDVELIFRTKNKKLVRRKVDNAALAGGVRSLVGLENGARLFRFEERGEIVNLTAPMLNEYIGEYLGNGFTAKDFRTWGRCSLRSSSQSTVRPRATMRQNAYSPR